MFQETTTLPSPVIGILGGMGSAATAHMYNRLIAKCQERGARTDQAFPTVIVSSIPIPYTNGLGWKDDAAVLSNTRKQIEQLQACGATVIVPACNTISLLLAHIDTRIPVLALPEIAAITLASRGYRRIAVACSAKAREEDLHHRLLLRHGIETVALTELEQETVNCLIDELIGVPAQSSHAQTLEHLRAEVCARGAQDLLLGCTELSLVQMIDKLDSLEFALDFLLDYLSDSKTFSTTDTATQPYSFLSKELLCA
jgi:aspartate racemase